jgi:hypothetical protein
VPKVARWLGLVVQHSSDGCAPKVGLEAGVAAVEGRRLRLGLAEVRERNVQGGSWCWRGHCHRNGSVSVGLWSSEVRSEKGIGKVKF